MTMTGRSIGPEIRVTPPGPKAKEIIGRDRAVITSAYTRAYDFVIDRGSGVFAWDPDGNRYLDFTAGVGVNALGHAHPEIVRVVREQAEKFLHMAGTDFYYEIMERYSAKLCALSPGAGENQVFLTNSGTESVEAAIKLARYMTRRPKMIAFYDAFHGRSLGSLSLTASKAIQRRHFAPLLDVAHAPYGDLDFLDSHLFSKVAPPEDVAAVFVEPIQGEGGYNVPPDDFLPGLRERCDRHGIFLVVDEIQAGLGRTGRWWAHQHWGIEPDIMTTAKPVGGGLPLGAIVARKKSMGWPSGAHANTFGGNPLGCAAGLRTMEILEEEGLVANAARMGGHLVSRLEEIARRHPALGAVHGKGLMQAIDVTDGEMRDRVVQGAFRRGLLLLGCGKRAIRFLPPLNVKSEEIDAAMDVFEEAAKAV